MLDHTDLWQFWAPVSKLTECAAQQQLLNFFESTQQLNPSNHAYQKTSKHNNYTHRNTRRNTPGDGTEKNDLNNDIGPKRGFRLCVPHTIAGKTWEIQGGTQVQDKWIKEYLVGRTQYVTLVGSQSLHVKCKKRSPAGVRYRTPPIRHLYQWFDKLNQTKGLHEHDTPGDEYTFRETMWKLWNVLSIYADDSTFTISRQEQTNRTRTT